MSSEFTDSFPLEIFCLSFDKYLYLNRYISDLNNHLQEIHLHQCKKEIEILCHQRK